MAKTSAIQKNKRRERLVKKYANKRANNRTARNAGPSWTAMSRMPPSRKSLLPPMPARWWGARPDS